MLNIILGMSARLKRLMLRILFHARVSLTMIIVPWLLMRTGTQWLLLLMFMEIKLMGAVRIVMCMKISPCNKMD